LKIIGHSLKNLDPSQKTLRHPWCLKLVTGLSTATDILMLLFTQYKTTRDLPLSAMSLSGCITCQDDSVQQSHAGLPFSTGAARMRPKKVMPPRNKLAKIFTGALYQFATVRK